MSSPATYFVLRLTLGGLFILAALEKARRPSSFVDAVRQYRIVPAPLVPATALGVVLAEAVIGVTLTADLVPELAASSAAGLLTAFVVAVGLNFLRGNMVSCHCFGSGDSERIGLATLLRSALLLGLSLALLLLVLHGASGSLVVEPAIAGVLIAMTLATTIRSFPLVVDVWRYLMAPAVVPPTAARRISFKHEPPDASLRIGMMSSNGVTHPPFGLDHYLVKRGEE